VLSIGSVDSVLSVGSARSVLSRGGLKRDHVDAFPIWSPDGETLIFWRRAPPANRRPAILDQTYTIRVGQSTPPSRPHRLASSEETAWLPH